MTVSPTAPVPRVAPTASTPSRYTQLMAVPSIFSSQSQRTSVPGGRPRATRSAQARRSSSLNALSSDCIGSRWVNGGKASSSGAPTCWVGESGVCSDGVLALELLEAVEPGVEVGVGHRRLGQHVVAVAGLADLAGELVVLGSCRGEVPHRRSEATEPV